MHILFVMSMVIERVGPKVRSIYSCVYLILTLWYSLFSINTDFGYKSFLEVKCVARDLILKYKQLSVMIISSPHSHKRRMLLSFYSIASKQLTTMILTL